MIHKKRDIWENIKQGFFSGLGWSIGTTVGFAILVTLLLNIIKIGGGLPLVGNFFASIVESTQQSLISRENY